VNRTDYTLLAAALLFMFVLGGVTDKDKTVNIHETTVNNQSIDTDSDLQNLEITWTAWSRGATHQVIQTSVMIMWSLATRRGLMRL